MDLYSTYSDGELLQLLHDSDERAFKEIFSRYWERMLAIAFNLTHDQSAAKEIVQELFASIWKRRSVLTISTLEGYLATAIKFSFFKQVERDRRRHTLEMQSASAMTSKETNPDQEVEALFLEQYLQGLLEKLPEKCRLVFQLSRFQHLSNTEIAEHLQISEKTVEGHLTKGIKILRIHLQDSSLAVIVVAALKEWF